MNSVVRTLLFGMSLVALTVAHAAEIKPFDQKTFDTLQAAGKPVVIHVYADWCPTCRQQTPIVSELISMPQFKDFTVLRVNFDTQKDVRQALRVAEQSTLIVYRGRNEVARTIGDTSKDSIAATLRKAAS
jgi:thiol-disulfide isomerase/thioredoxin